MKVNRVVIAEPADGWLQPGDRARSEAMAADRCIGCNEPIGFDVLHLSGVCGGRYVVLCGPCLTGRLCTLFATGAVRTVPGVNGEEVPPPSHGGGTSPVPDRGGLDLEAALGERRAPVGAAR